MTKRARQEDDEEVLLTLTRWSQGSIQTSYFMPPRHFISSTSTVIKIHEKSGKFHFIIQSFPELTKYLILIEKSIYNASYAIDHNFIVYHNLHDENLFLKACNPPYIFNKDKSPFIGQTDSFSYGTTGKVKISARHVTRIIKDDLTKYFVHYSFDQLMLDDYNTNTCAW